MSAQGEELVRAAENAKALVRIIFELDDLVRSTRLVPRRVRRAVDQASSLAMQPDVAARCRKIQNGKEILGG